MSKEKAVQINRFPLFDDLSRELLNPRDARVEQTCCERLAAPVETLRGTAWVVCG